VLLKLFTLLAERRSEATRHTLERHLQVQPRKLSSARDAFRAFQQMVVAGGHNLYEVFGQVRRVPEQNFSKWLDQMQFSLKRDLLALFLESDGVNLAKMVQYIRKDFPDYGSTRDVSKLPLPLKILLQKLCVQLALKPLTVEQLRKDLDRNQDGKVTCEEFDAYLVANQVCCGFSSKQVQALFEFADTN
jgi:hypothetical protein